MGTKDTFEEDLEEYDEDEASSNEETEEEGKKDSMVANKGKEVVAKRNAKGKAVAKEETETPNWYGPNNAYSHTSYDLENGRLFKNYSAQGFIVEEETFRTIGVQKIIEDREWMHTVSDIKGFIRCVIHEFYANLSENINVAESLEFEKVYVCGRVYEFSTKVICEYLKILMYSFNEFDKTYNMDGVMSELLRTKSTWPKNNSLRAIEITFKYFGLHKIVINNWSLTTHYTTLSKDMCTLVFDIGSVCKLIWGNHSFLTLLILRLEGRRIKTCRFRH